MRTAQLLSVGLAGENPGATLDRLELSDVAMILDDLAENHSTIADLDVREQCFEAYRSILGLRKIAKLRLSKLVELSVRLLNASGSGRERGARL